MKKGKADYLKMVSRTLKHPYLTGAPPEELKGRYDFLLERARDFLEEGEHLVLVRRKNDVSLAKIGEELDLTQERVRQIESRALRKLARLSYQRVLDDVEIEYIIEGIGGRAADALKVLYEEKHTLEHRLEKFETKGYGAALKALEIVRDIKTSGGMVVPENVIQQVNETLQSEILQNRLSTPIDYFDFPIRVYNCLEMMRVKYLGDLVSKDEYTVLRHRNVGRKTLAEIKQFLKGMGLRLGMKLRKHRRLDNLSDEEMEEINPLLERRIENSLEIPGDLFSYYRIESIITMSEDRLDDEIRRYVRYRNLSARDIRKTIEQALRKLHPALHLGMAETVKYKVVEGELS